VQYKFSKTCVITAALCFFSAGVAQATTIDIIREATNPYETVYGMHENTGSDGYQIDGASISATFAGAPTEDLTWEANRTIYTEPNGDTWHGIDGAARGDNINMFMSWDGFEMTTTSLLTSLTIDLMPSNSVFDTTFIFDYNDPNGQSTIGSSFGFEFELYSEYQSMPGYITAAYSGIVNVAGDAAVGDLFTTLTLDFSGLAGGGLLGNLNFRSDIDSMRYANDLTPVPLPASLSFLLIGLAAGAGFFGRKQSGKHKVSCAIA
jgi:hypothetical protein